jgi:hypothetical protein
MNKPKLSAYIFGTPFTGSAFLVASLAMIYFWYVRQNDEEPLEFLWVLPLLGGAFLVKIISSIAQVRAYKKWKEDYEAVALGPDEARRRKNWRTFFAVVFTGALIYFGRPYVEPQFWVLSAGLYGLMVLVWFAKMLFFSGSKESKPAQQRQPQPQAKAAATPAAPEETRHVVSVALSVPRNSPDASKAAGALPDYCQALLRR